MASKKRPTSMSLHDKVDDVRESVAGLNATLVAHTKQDELFYNDVRGMAGKMSDYNGLLREHIAGVNQLKEMHVLLKQQVDCYKTDYDGAIKKTEQAFESINQKIDTVLKPFAWVTRAWTFVGWVGNFETALQIAKWITILGGTGWIAILLRHWFHT